MTQKIFLSHIIVDGGRADGPGRSMDGPTMVPAWVDPYWNRTTLRRTLFEGCPMTHTSWLIPHQIEEGSNFARCLSDLDFWSPTLWARPRKTSKLYLDRLAHHFENPYGYHNVWNQIIFHLRYFPSTHAITRPRKIEKTQKPVSGTFLKANFSNLFFSNIFSGFEIRVSPS